MNRVYTCTHELFVEMSLLKGTLEKLVCSLQGIHELRATDRGRQLGQFPQGPTLLGAPGGAPAALSKKKQNMQ